MPISDAEYDRLEAALASGDLDPAYAARAREVLSKRSKTGASVTPAPDNSLGVTGIVNQPEAPVAHEETEEGRIAAALDPRFDLIPQGLALLPATNDSRGVEGYKAGTTGPVKYAYEPPVSVVRKQLLENPGMLQLLRSDPPTPQEIETLDSDSPLYQDAANYMWARTMEAATKGGYQVYRYSKMPWGQEGDVGGGLGALGLKLGGAMQPLQNLKDAYVLGLDDTATLGAARATQESTRPEQRLNVPGDIDVMGVNEDAPQKTAEVNEWTAEESPIAYGLGQATGAAIGAPQRIYNMIMEGGEQLAKLVAKTRLGGLLTKASPLAKAAGGIAADTAAGTAEAMATQAGQEAIDRDMPGERGPVLGAGERIMDTGESAALWGLGGSALGRLGGLGADAIRNADQFGGAVGRTESSLSYGPLSPLLGPSLNKDTKALVRRANREGNEAGDYIAEEIAPSIQQAAANRTRAAEGAQQAERANYQASEAGQQMLPVTGLQVASLDKLRRHHQPLPGGGLRAVDDKARDAQKVFNRHIDKVSLEPIEGAIKLTPDEASSFLAPSQRRKLLLDDIEAAGERRAGTVIDRKAYLETVDAKQRAAVDEEIQASIDDLLQQKKTGDRALDIDQRSAAYKEAEQQALRERVDEEQVLEPFGGSFADYLKQRGKEGVFVTPAAYDAKRTDTLIEGLSDKELLAAAKHDRAQRSHDGKRGGYSEMRDKHERDIAKAKKTEEEIAPKESAFSAVASHADKRAGDKEKADTLRGLADEAGVRPKLDQLRNLMDARNIQRQAWFRSPKNSPRGFGLQNVGDAMKIRAFPILRALEPGGDVTGGMMSRMALMGQVEEEAARQAEVERARPAYEERRGKVLDDKAAKREKAKKELERRRTERHRDE